jgi:hypothetical protein
VVEDHGGDGRHAELGDGSALDVRDGRLREKGADVPTDREIGRSAPAVAALEDAREQSRLTGGAGQRVGSFSTDGCIVPRALFSDHPPQTSATKRPRDPGLRRSQPPRLIGGSALGNHMHEDRTFTAGAGPDESILSTSLT